MTHSILFVCLGNICRSPLAEGVFRHLVKDAGRAGEFSIDSAGTGAWHIGHPPDPRSIEIAAKHGIDISSQSARQVIVGDFEAFDLILAMDRSNLAALTRQAGSYQSKVRLFADNPPADVPDPYYGGADGFEMVYRMIHNRCTALLENPA